MRNFTLLAEKPVEKYKRRDILFVLTVILLWGLGIFSLFICSPNIGEKLFDSKYYFVIRQLMWSIPAFMGFLLFALMPLKTIKKLLPLIVLGTLILCVLPLLPGIGDSRKGASRWVRIPFIGTFQPSEFAKFAVILFLANLFSKDKYIKQESSYDYVYPLIGIGLFSGIILLQKDLSTAFFVALIGILMFFVSGMKMRWFIPVVVFIIPLVVLVTVLEPYRLNRVVSFFHPEENMLGTGYQLFASRRAIIDGGVWGNGTGSALGYINSVPEIQSDYIFSGWASANGLVGVLAYFVVLGLFAWRGIKISFECPSRFASYGAFGCTVAIVAQSLLNIGVVAGAVPTTGINLPFFSSGGSSLMVTLAMCGFVVNSSHCTGETEESKMVAENSTIEDISGVVFDYE